MIALKNVSVVYQSEQDVYTALKGIDLTIEKGGTCAIIGPSGSGKSTLLKVIAGILRASEGEVTIAGEAVSQRRQCIGFMPQNYGLLPWETVEENISLGVRIKSRGKKLDRSVIQSVMRQLGIEGLEKRYPNELSGGQRQRVSLARVFLLKPDVLLMDEPFSALDAITREDIQDLFLKIWKKHHTTAAIVTHYVEEAVYLGQKIVVMSAQPGKISQIVANPLFGRDGVRGRAEFYELSNRLRRQIKINGETFA